MNATQAIIVLKNGARKYGFILNNDHSEDIQFIPGTENTFRTLESYSNLVERIPVENIVSIDTFLK
ncbi:MAG: hypothetical protein JST26_09080 [Bacteroidetes bacterium]|nr:hypothetical protein [Bacteroidota bacterium]